MITEILKINFDVGNIGGSGVKTRKKDGKRGAKICMKIHVSRTLTKSVEKYQGTTGILKIYLHVENVGGLGVKTTNKGGKLGTKFA